MNTIELVREAGIYDGREGLMWCSKEQLERFAALVRAETLEEAAEWCEAKQSYNAMHANTEFAAGIRGLK